MMCENGGCMSKLDGQQLLNLIYRAKESISEGIKIMSDNEYVEDCAVISSIKQELLYTADFGPPVGEDLFLAGKIAALNAISDIYAMGGVPRYAYVLLTLNKDLLFQQKEQLLAGVYQACNEENTSVVGGHTINGEETLVGLSVIGEIKNGRLLHKKNCCIDDAIMISKSLGTGLVLRGYYLGLLSEEDYQRAIDIMIKSNFVDDTIVASPLIHAMTDVTGFGLVGHMSEMLDKDKGAVIYIEKVPYIKNIDNLSVNIMLNNYIENNYIYAEDTHKIKFRLDTMKKIALFDPQTNGPLLISVDKKFVSIAETLGFVYIGDVINTPEIIISNE